MLHGEGLDLESVEVGVQSEQFCLLVVPLSLQVDQLFVLFVDLFRPGSLFLFVLLGLLFHILHGVLVPLELCFQLVERGVVFVQVSFILLLLLVKLVLDHTALLHSLVDVVDLVVQILDLDS